MAEARLQTQTEIGDELDGASNVLFLTSSMDREADELCLNLLAGEDIDRTNVLLTTFTTTPDTWMQSWTTTVGRPPANLKIISVGEITRSAAVRTPGVGGPTTQVVDTVSSPGDLTGLGIKVSEQLEAWNGDGNRTSVCFDSVTALLQTAELQTAFRFLHVLTGRFDAVDATAYFYLDPEAFDDRTVSTLTMLFDATVTRDGDEWVVRTR